MPPKFDHPVLYALAVGGVAVSFVASMVHSASTAAFRTVFAAVDNATVLSWAGTAVAVLALVAAPISRMYKEGRKTKLEADSDEAGTWSGMLRAETKIRGTLEGRNEFLEKRVADLEAQLHAVQRGVQQVAASVTETRKQSESQGDRISAVESNQSSMSLPLPQKPTVKE